MTWFSGTTVGRAGFCVLSPQIDDSPGAPCEDWKSVVSKWSGTCISFRRSTQGFPWTTGCSLQTNFYNILINLFTFENAAGESIQIAGREVSDATVHARELFHDEKFKLLRTERHPDWDDFAEVFNPQVMLERDVEDEDIPGLFFISEREFPSIRGFHDLAKNGHVWTVCDFDGILWLVPGFRSVNRFAHVVTKKAHNFDKTPDYLYG